MNAVVRAKFHIYCIFNCNQKFNIPLYVCRYHRNKVHSTVHHYCDYCGKQYKWKGELRTHVQRNHMEHKERFQCSLCSRNYADRRKLRHHMTTKHNVPKEVTVTYYEYKTNYQVCRVYCLSLILIRDVFQGI